MGLLFLMINNMEVSLGESPVLDLGKFLRYELSNISRFNQMLDVW